MEGSLTYINIQLLKEEVMNITDTFKQLNLSYIESSEVKFRNERHTQKGNL